MTYCNVEFQYIYLSSDAVIYTGYVQYVVRSNLKYYFCFLPYNSHINFVVLRHWFVCWCNYRFNKVPIQIIDNHNLKIKVIFIFVSHKIK